MYCGELDILDNRECGGSRVGLEKGRRWGMCVEIKL